MKLQLIYDGKALENHEINPKDLSSALLGMNSLLEEANSVLNNRRAQIHVKVKASFETGCFKINFSVCQNLLDQVKDLWTHVDPILGAEGIISLVFGSSATAGGLVGLLKFLKGLRAEKIVENEDGSFTVFCIKQEFKTEKRVIQLYQSFKLRQHFEQLISPLDKEGVDDCSIKIDDKKEDYCQITKEEVDYFKCPKPRELKLDEEPVRFKTSIIVNLT